MDIKKDRRGFLEGLKASPEFKDIDRVRFMAETFLLDKDSVVDDPYPSEEEIKGCEGLIRDIDYIMAFLEGKRERYPDSLPVFKDPEEMIVHFVERWEGKKEHYC